MKNQKKKEEFSLKEQYEKSWNYILYSKKFILVMIFLFFLFVLIGAFVPATSFILEQISKFIEELLSQTEGLSRFELIQFILINNLQVSFGAIVLGIFFGIFPILFAISNGYFLGIISLESIKEKGFLILLNLLPHGIFELPAIFISLGLGLFLGYHSIIFTYNFIKYHKTNLPVWLLITLLILFPIIFLMVSLILDFNEKKFSKNIYGCLKNSLRVFFFIILPLLVFAAVIEGSFVFFLR